MPRYPYLEPEIVSAAEVSRNFGQWQDRAIAGPVIVTHHGRARVAIISAEHFEPWRDLAGEPAKRDQPLDAETSLSIVLDHIGESFYSLDKNHKFLSVNGAACTFFGYSPTQLIGHSITERFPALEGSILLDRIKRVQRTGEELDFEGISPAFPDRVVKVKIFPHPQGVGVIFKNVTDELNKDRSHIESKTILHLLSISRSIGYIKLNIRGFPTHCSEVLYEITGLNCKQVCHARFVELFPMSERKIVAESLEQVLNHGHAISIQSKIYSKGDQDVDVELSIVADLDDSGVVGAMVLVNFYVVRPTQITDNA